MIRSTYYFSAIVTALAAAQLVHWHGQRNDQSMTNCTKCETWRSGFHSPCGDAMPNQTTKAPTATPVTPSRAKDMPSSITPIGSSRLRFFAPGRIKHGPLGRRCLALFCDEYCNGTGTLCHNQGLFDLPIRKFLYAHIIYNKDCFSDYIYFFSPPFWLKPSRIGFASSVLHQLTPSSPG